MDMTNVTQILDAVKTEKRPYPRAHRIGYLNFLIAELERLQKVSERKSRRAAEMHREACRLLIVAAEVRDELRANAA